MSSTLKTAYEPSAQAPCKGRFAPSPTGRMHAGNIYAYLCSWLITKSQQGSIVLRIEDLDIERSKAQYCDQIQKDFELLGLTWDEGPYYQNCESRQSAYRDAFEQLQNNTYPCFCTRASLKALSAPHFGENRVYPGICRTITPLERATRAQSQQYSTRLKVSNEYIAFHDGIQGTYGQHLDTECGDFVIRRADGLFSYQLAVVVDDAYQKVNTIVRGYDLISSTPQQIYLQRILGLPEPQYYHIPLFINEKGRRLSKRDKDASLDELLMKYKNPQAVLGHIAYVGKLIEFEEALSAEELLKNFSLTQYVQRVQGEVGTFEPIIYT